MEKRNILLIVIDCLRADFVYEPGMAYTPTLDSLRESGFSFINAITTTTSTTPSFASLLMGQYPFEHGVRSHSGYKLRDDARTLPAILAEAGYHTHAEVTGPLGVEVGLAKGFQEYNYRPRANTLHTEWGREFLRKIEQRYRKPWFTLLHIWSLHKRRCVLPECDGKKFGKTVYGRAFSSIDVYLGRLIETVSDDTLMIITGDHGEEISSGRLDKMGRKFRTKFFRFLKKRGLTRKHISHALRHSFEGHGHALYDTLVKVPLIFHCKGLIRAGHSEIQVRQIDIFPTIAEAVGVAVPPDVTGQSTLEIIHGKKANHRDAYLEAAGVTIPDKNEWLSGIRVDNKYKYIYAPFRSDFAPELYDLENDPGEVENIAAKHPEIAAEMRRRIETMKVREQLGAELSPDEQQRVMARLKDLGYVD